MADTWDHKQVMHLLRQMVLASGLPFEPAKINKHWPRLSYGPALGQGQHSLGEVADLYFTAPVAVAPLQEKLNASAPQGMRILRVRRVPYALPSVSQLVEVVKYGVQGDFSVYAPGRSAEEFFGAKHIYLTVQAANGMTLQQDVKQFVQSVTQPEPTRLELFLQKYAGQMVKPEQVVAAWLQVKPSAAAEFALPGIEFIREALYWRDSLGSLHAL